jgi:hypothetical protein
LLSDLRASVASSHDLIESFPLSFGSIGNHSGAPDNLADLLTPAVANTYNPLLTKAEAANFSNKTFVDNKGGVLAIQECCMRDTLHQSLLSAFLLFGFPGADRHGACL